MRLKGKHSRLLRKLCVKNVVGKRYLTELICINTNLQANDLAYYMNVYKTILVKDLKILGSDFL